MAVWASLNAGSLTTAGAGSLNPVSSICIELFQLMWCCLEKHWGSIQKYLFPSSLKAALACTFLTSKSVGVCGSSYSQLLFSCCPSPFPNGKQSKVYSWRTLIPEWQQGWDTVSWGALQALLCLVFKQRIIGIQMSQVLWFYFLNSELASLAYQRWQLNAFLGTVSSCIWCWVLCLPFLGS